MIDDESVVITGMGLVTAMGSTLAASWPDFLGGKSGIGPCRQFDVSGHACATAAEIPEYGLPELRLPKNRKFMGRGVVHLMQAACEAVGNSGLDLASMRGDRIGVYTGSGQIGPEPSEFFAAFHALQRQNIEADWIHLGGAAGRLIDPYFPLRTLSNAGVALLAMEFGAHGPTNNFVQSDVCGAFALEAACRDLRAGRCDVAIVGAFDHLTTPALYLAYEQSGLLAAQTLRPFDVHAAGLVLGEGAAAMVLERSSDIGRRNAEALAEVSGIGAASETADGIEPFATTRPLIECTQQALGRNSVCFAVASGFGIPAADRREAVTLESVFRGATPITALKGQTGYLGAATALVEAVLAVQMLRDRVALPIVPHETAIPELRGIVTEPIRLQRPLSALCLSHSWAGQAAAIYLRRQAPPFVESGKGA